MDFKDQLLEELKGKGLNIAEDALASLVEAVFDAGVKYVQNTENKFDDLVIAAVPSVKGLLLAELDKLDGEDDEGR
jgi:hypothetical protein